MRSALYWVKSSACALLRPGLLLPALLLVACGEKEERVCCAIEPKAKCEAQLLGSGVTREELAILKGPGATICPGPALSEARLREIAGKWPADCRNAFVDPLRGLDSGQCATASTQTPDEAPK